MRLDDAVTHFRRAVDEQRLAQAYVLAGDPREEGRLVAERVLQMLCCAATDRPCGQCRACTQVAKHTNPDTLWVEPQSKSRRIAIEQIRDAQHLIQQTSFTGGWKACVLVSAERLGPEAANAFLKTLEEPPPRCVFFLLTENPRFLLPTIVSRCQMVAISGGAAEAQDAWAEALTAILRADETAGGAAPGRARPGVAAGHNLVASYARAESVCRTLKGMKKAAEEAEKRRAEATGETVATEDDDVMDARIAARYREMRTAFMRSLLFWYRDILLLVCGAADDVLHHRGHADFLRTKARDLTHRQALDNVRTVETMNTQLERNISDNVVMNYGFTKLV